MGCAVCGYYIKRRDYNRFPWHWYEINDYLLSLVVWPEFIWYSQADSEDFAIVCEQCGGTARRRRRLPSRW